MASPVFFQSSPQFRSMMSHSRFPLRGVAMRLVYKSINPANGGLINERGESYEGIE
jgi:hypothetical protein